jgi:hypothetical protein
MVDAWAWPVAGHPCVLRGSEAKAVDVEAEPAVEVGGSETQHDFLAGDAVSAPVAELFWMGFVHCGCPLELGEAPRLPGSMTTGSEARLDW